MEPVYVGYLTKYGFCVSVNTMKTRLGRNYITFLNKLTFIKQQKVGYPKRIQIYSIKDIQNSPCLFMPRGMASVLLSNGIINRIDIKLPLVEKINAPLKIELYDDQKIIIDHLVNNIYTQERIDNGTATCILNLRAGRGKSYVAAGLISVLGLRTIYIVPKCPLAIQGVKDLKLALNDDNVLPLNDDNKQELTISAYKNNMKEYPDILVIVINSALQLHDDVISKYSLVIMDEVHMYCSDKRKEIFNLMTTRCVLGMSATTEDRTDGLDIIAHKELVCGDNGIIRAENLPGFSYGDDNLYNATARIINYFGASEHTKHLTHPSTGMLFTHYMHNQFINDSARLAVAIDELIQLYDWRGEGDTKHHIYVFAEELDILKTAKNAFIAALDARGRNDLAEDILIPESAAGLFIGGLKENEINDITNNKRVLFSTYGYAGQGISILKMSAILLLTPRKAAMKQIFARILRRGSDTAIPRIIVDIVDKRTALKYQVNARKLAYDFYGFKQVEINVKIHEGDNHHNIL